MCRFKYSQFLKARPCLEESEPLTFLKCDQKCRLNANDLIEEKYETNEQKKYLENGKVKKKNYFY